MNFSGCFLWGWDEKRNRKRLRREVTAGKGKYTNTNSLISSNVCCGGYPLILRLRLCLLIFWSLRSRPCPLIFLIWNLDACANAVSSWCVNLWNILVVEKLCCQMLVRGRVLIILLVRGCVLIILLEEVVSSYYCLEAVSSYYCLKVVSSYYCLEAVSSYYFCLRCGCIPRLSMFQECMLSVKPLS